MRGRHLGRAAREPDNEHDWLDEFLPEGPAASSAVERSVLALPERPPVSQPSGIPLLGEPIQSPRLPPAHTPEPPPLLSVLRAKLPSVRPAPRSSAIFAGAFLTVVALLGPDVFMLSRQPPPDPASLEAQARAREQAALARPVYPPPASSTEAAPVDTADAPVSANVAPVRPAPAPARRPAPAPVRPAPASGRSARAGVLASSRATAPPGTTRQTAARPSAQLPPPQPSAIQAVSPNRTSTSTPPPAPTAPVSQRASVSESAAPLDRLLGPAVGQPLGAPPTAPGSMPPGTPGPSASAATNTTDQTRLVQTASVRAVLDRYRQAFANLDASAVAPFWPGVNARALERAFDQLESQEFKFDRCQINLTGARAVASCQGQASTVRKVGSREPRIEPRQWTFALNRVNDAWLIQNVSSQPGR